MNLNMGRAANRCTKCSAPRKNKAMMSIVHLENQLDEISTSTKKEGMFQSVVKV